MPKKYLITKEELVQLFIVQNLRRKEVAKYFGCSEPLIKSLCRNYDIKKPKNLENKNKERKKEVSCMYCNSLFSTKKFRTTNIKWLAKYCSYSCAHKARYLGPEHKQKIRNEIASRRRARLKQQAPTLTEEETTKIKEIYLSCPEGYEVDHIIPISKGGIHHPDNLQILTITENRKKWSKLNYNTYEKKC